MKAEEIKANLNKRVRFKSSRLGIDSEYKLTGAIFRKGEKGFFYQAEIQDLRTNNSIIICGLEDIEPICDDKSQNV